MNQPVSSLPRGTNFARMVIAKAVGGPNQFDAIDFAAARWGENSAPARLLKAAVGAGSTASDLAPEYASATTEFLSLVRQRSILGRLPGLRRVPRHTPVLLQTGEVDASWVAEGRAVPVSNMTFQRTAFDTLKVAALTVSTDELLQSSDPSAEQTIRADLINAVTAASDLAFIDPANAGVAGEKPASVTNGLTAIASTGSDLDGTRANITRLIRSFGGDLTTAVFVGSPELFVQMNTVAPENYPNLGARGGDILGIPAIASNSVPDAGGNYQLALIDPTGIVYVADDGGAEIRVSRQGTIEMNDAPAGSSVMPTGTTSVSLFQTNSVAIGAMMRENWAAVRPGSVALLSGIVPTPVA